MTRETLEAKEKELLEEIIVLGGMVQRATVDSVEALRTRDMQESQRVFDEDEVINQLRFKIENETLITIATQQPLATDLRILASIFEICTELERMGDYAKGIAKINLMIGDTPLIKELVNLPKMAAQVADMLNRALLAFIDQDEKTAREIHTEDDVVDEYYILINKELMGIMISDPTKLDQANHLLWAAHNLERLADRVTNICERTIFVVTGELIELSDSE
jgi:phosphate transport system protein